MKTMRWMLSAWVAAAFLALSALAAAAQDIVDTIARDPELSTFTATVKAAGLETAMKAKGPITVLAPTNAAFARLGANTLERLMQPANKKALEEIVKFHVLPADYPLSRLSKAYQDTFKITTPEGTSLLFDVTRLKRKAGPLVVEGLAVTRIDIKAANGTIYIIDAVLLPPKHRSLAPRPGAAPAAAAPTRSAPAPAAAPAAEPAKAAAPAPAPAAPVPATPAVPAVGGSTAGEGVPKQ